MALVTASLTAVLMSSSSLRVGSIWAAMMMWVHMEVVVVLPWVPEMHRAFL